jgi:hypothetical protein
MMRNVSICFLLTVALAFSGMLYAQEEGPHVYTLVTWELLSPEDGSDAEYDSLSAFWVENAVKKNEFIVSSIAMSHLWGSNSSDFVIITEYKNFADIEKASNRYFELIVEAIPDKEERGKYYKAFFKYLGNHSDEIYQAE